MQRTCGLAVFLWLVTGLDSTTAGPPAKANTLAAKNGTLPKSTRKTCHACGVDRRARNSRARVFGMLCLLEDLNRTTPVIMHQNTCREPPCPARYTGCPTLTPCLLPLSLHTRTHTHTPHSISHPFLPTMGTHTPTTTTANDDTATLHHITMVFLNSFI